MPLLKNLIGVTLISTVVAVSVDQLFDHSYPIGKDAINTTTTPGFDVNVSMASSPVGNRHVKSPSNLLAAQVNALQKQVNTLVRVVNNLELRLVQQPTQEIEDKDDLESNTLNDEDQLADQKLAAYESDEDDFIQQDYDSSWALAKEAALRTQISAQGDIPLTNSEPLPESVLDNLECRATSCRLEIAATEAMSELQDQFILKAMGVFSSIDIHYTKFGDAVIIFRDE